MIDDEIKTQKLPSSPPVLVMMPMADWQPGQWGGSFVRPTETKQTQQIIGLLGPEFQVPDGLTAFDAVAATLAAKGMDLKVYLGPSERSADGHIGCGVCYAVHVDSWEQAKTLPSFIPLIMFSGYQPPIVPTVNVAA